MLIVLNFLFLILPLLFQDYLNCFLKSCLKFSFNAADSLLMLCINGFRFSFFLSILTFCKFLFEFYNEKIMLLSVLNQSSIED